jgi:hypothetical protein
MVSFAVACVGCAAIMGREKEKEKQHATQTESENSVHPKSMETPYRTLIAIGLLQFLGNFATSITLISFS